MLTALPASSPAPPRLRVTFADSSLDRRTLQFSRNFNIGRGKDSDVCIHSVLVSRTHAEVEFQAGQWFVKDLNSSNGIFVAGLRVSQVVIDGALTLRLGAKGPVIELEIAAQVPTPKSAKTKPQEQWAERYFGKEVHGQLLGEHTIMVRRAFAEIQKRQRRHYGWLVGGLAALVVASGAYTLHLHQEVSKNKEIAEELFYSMKSLDLNIANIEKKIEDEGHERDRQEVGRLQKSRQDTELNYDRLLTALRVSDPKMTQQQRLILRVARIFGECEVAMPPEFATEIENYINKWKSSGKLAAAVALANHRGYTAFISRELLDHDLPRQFFYLALQESGFDPYISGPLTRKGYAKGMWQFIPETAANYGLKIGPLVNLPRPDTGDDRNHYELATKAAARYLKDLYSTDAQASGLLVMACYNWGEKSVLPLVQSLPANPRERNFWQLLKRYRDKIPPETYDYVFSITSAAVIGEDPRLFGFQFDNPLSLAK